MTRPVSYVRRFAPKAKSQYVAAFENGDALFQKYEVTTPLRMAHFLAQVFHESGGLTILRENFNYTTSARILEIFGPRHSAKVTAKEAPGLVRQPKKLANRVYGVGNPSMAKRLGNTRPNDGWDMRGNGPMQTTGRYNHRAMGQAAGLGDLFEHDPSKVTSAEYALIPALVEWERGNCNAYADKNDLLSISRIINLGNAKSTATPNGVADRRAWFDKIYPAIRKSGVTLNAGSGVAQKVEESAPLLTDGEIKNLQKKLRDLGYFEVGLVDGKIGKNTRSAIFNFQGDNDLPESEEFDEATIRALATTTKRKPVTVEGRESLTAKDLSKAGDQVVAGAEAVKTTTVIGGATAVVIGVSEQVGQASALISPLTSWLSDVPGWVWALLAIGVAVALWSSATKVERARLKAVRSGEDAGPA